MNFKLIDKAYEESKRFQETVLEMRKRIQAIKIDDELHNSARRANANNDGNTLAHPTWQKCPRGIGTYSSAVKRASMDLSRALISMRQDT